MTIVYAFDPVDELDGRCGLLTLDTEQARPLLDRQRVELVELHLSESLRYVDGSAANEAARQALRRARAAAAAAVTADADDEPPARQRRQARH